MDINGLNLTRMLPAPPTLRGRAPEPEYSEKFSEVLRRSRGDLSGQVSLMRSPRTQAFSLMAYIAHRVNASASYLWAQQRDPDEFSDKPVSAFPVGERSAAVDAVLEASEYCRNKSGRAPEGTWIPLAAFARTITTTSDAGTIALENGVRPGSVLQQGLAAESAVFGSATLLTGLTGGKFDLLAEAASAIDLSGAWQPEVGATGAIEPGFTNISLVPKTIRFWFDLSRQIFLTDKVDLELQLRQLIIRRVMGEIDHAAFVGAGGNAPGGLLYHPGVQVLSTGMANGAAPNWQQLTELEYQVSTRAGAMIAPHIVTSPKVRRAWRQIQRAAGLDFIYSDANAGRLLNVPLTVTPHSPDNLTKGTSVGVCSAVMYGDLSELIVGFWGPAAVDIDVDPITQAKDGKVRIFVRADVAVAPRNAGAFAAYKDLLA